MGKIGNSLSRTMSLILSGELNYEELEKIYAGTCFTREEAEELIKHYDLEWGAIAYDRAENELGEEASFKEICKREGELLPQVTLEAKKLLQQLLDDNKIVQTRYILPEGQKAKVKFLDHGSISEKNFTGDERIELVAINGQLYHTSQQFSLGSPSSKEIYDSELELIAAQLAARSNSDKDFCVLLPKLFPQYEIEIGKMIEYIEHKEQKGHKSAKLEELLELVQSQEHTSDEIGEATEHIDAGPALETFVNEMDKDKSGPDGH